jgi:ADP-heptose:LPS heptosyltransferase
MQTIDRQYIKNRKRINLLIEHFFVWLMNLGRSRQTPDPGAVRSVLVIRHNQLGDAVAASSFIEACRTFWPNARVEVLASKANAEAFSWVPGVDTVYTRPHGFFGHLAFFRAQRGRHDIVFQTLFDEHYFKRTLAARILAGRGIAVGRKRGSPLEALFDQSVYLPCGGYVGKLMSLLTPFCSLTPLDLISRHPTHKLTLPARHLQTAQDKLHSLGIEVRTYIALNISARVSFRELAAEQAALLSDACLRKGMPVVLLHAPSDQEKAQRIKQLSPGITLPGCTSLGEAMAWAQLARLYLGADTGTAHFAAAGLTPCVVLFSYQASADVWSPYGVPFVSIQANPDQPVSDIDSDLVIEQIDRILTGEPLTRVIKSTPYGFSTGTVLKNSLTCTNQLSSCTKKQN